MRTARVLTLLVCLSGVLSPLAAHAQTVAPVAVTPTTVPVAVATPVTFTAVISDPAVIADSVQLQRIDAAGRVISVVGLLQDDGSSGDVTAGDKTFTLRLSLFEVTPGPLTYRVSAAFQGRLTRVLSAVMTVTRTGTAANIEITQPAPMAFINVSPTRVSGTVGDRNARVTINGVAATVTNGAFTALVPVLEGTNTLTAAATNASGTVTTASVQVTLDTTPPRLNINTPDPNFRTTAATIDVGGLVNDIVVGTVNPLQATVVVNGHYAQVANRSFLATGIPLSMGSNTIQVSAMDRSGNSATASVIVFRVPVTPGAITTVSGSGQSGAIGTVVTAPLVVGVTNGLGLPAAGVPVVFRVQENSGGFISGSATLGSLAVITNSAGRASVSFRLGSRAGAGNNVVEATATGVSGTAVFTLSGTSAAARHIVVDTGNGQTGVVGQALTLPFVAIVTDAGHNRLAGVPVTFTVRQGGGAFAGQLTRTATSDADGRVAVTLTLGQLEGADNNIVEATFPGNTGLPVAFLASARVPGNAAQTRITGVVLDNSNDPIPGVTMRLFRTHHGTGVPEQVATPVQTDGGGNFLIAPAPVGTFKLMADGGTAEDGPWPTLEFDITTVAGRSTDVGLPIYLPALDMTNSLCVTETTGGTLTLRQVPGFALTLAPGSATFPGGSRTGCVTVTPVNGDKVPMAPGFGQQPRFVVTIQPVGTVFNPPAQLTLPNVDGLVPRAVTEMYSYDHDLSAFVSIGTGTVSEDGAVIASDPGVGVIKAGWHCGGNPNPAGSAGDCGDCARCQGTQCVEDNSRPPQQTQNDCKKKVCQGGQTVEENDDTDHNEASCCSEGQKTELTVTRTNLRTTTARVTPALPQGAQFTYTARALEGQNNPTYTTQNATANPNTGDIRAPANAGPPVPGGRSELRVEVNCPASGNMRKQFQAATFGLSCYVLAAEADHINAQGNCGSLRIGGNIYTGAIIDPPGLPAGSYCNAFLHDVVLQGSGTAANGTMVHYEGGGHTNPRFSQVQQFTGADGNALIPNGSVARDRAVVPRNTTVQLERGNFVANDTGGAIRGYRLDIFGGAGRAACGNFPNPIEVGACSPSTARCPPLAIP